MVTEQRTGTTNRTIECTYRFHQLSPQRWLIGVDWDEDTASFLWYWIRWLTDEQREALAAKIIAQGLAYEMINLTVCEDDQPMSLEDYLKDSGEKNKC